MKVNQHQLAAVLLTAIVFTLLFYNQTIGINLLIFEVFILGILHFFRRFTFNRESLIVLSCTVITGLLVVVHNSQFVIFTNFLSLFLLTGVLLYPQAKSLFFSFCFAFRNSFFAPIELFKGSNFPNTPISRVGNALKWIRLTGLSVLVLVLFVAMYKAANPVFDGMTAGISLHIGNLFTAIFGNINAAVVFTFILGLIISSFLIFKTLSGKMINRAATASNNMSRIKKPQQRIHLSLELKREWKAAILLLVMLNLLLLLINIIDIYWVWLNFEWEGEYLKQFVHEGTTVLIISILISIAISLYLFRGNLNFFSKSPVLKGLTYFWLAQNAVLAISVGVRNFHYIQYYALAYKRIGVIFFLLAVIIGLITVMYKIRNVRSVFYLLRVNTMSVFLILIVMSLFNWDGIIAKYNFSHADRSFVHFDFLSTLNPGTFPHLDKDLETLNRIEQGNERFPSKIKYMTAEEFRERVAYRKEHFRLQFEKQHWLSWNLASQRAYDYVAEESDS